MSLVGFFSMRNHAFLSVTRSDCKTFLRLNISKLNRPWGRISDKKIRASSFRTKISLANLEVVNTFTLYPGFLTPNARVWLKIRSYMSILGI